MEHCIPQKLLTLLPSEEEKTKLVEAQLARPDVPLGSAEQFLLMVSSISEVRSRLKLWLFMLDFDSAEGVSRMNILTKYQEIIFLIIIIMMMMMIIVTINLLAHDSISGNRRCPLSPEASHGADEELLHPEICTSRSIGCR